MAEIGVMKKLTIGDKTYTIPEYNLPIASASVLGGVKIGSGLQINSTTGVLSITDIPDVNAIIASKTDTSIDVSRVGSIVLDTTEIGTTSTNLPTSRAVVEYVEERLEHFMSGLVFAIDIIDSKKLVITEA